VHYYNQMNMKALLFTCLSITLAITSQGQNSIEVKISNIREIKGDIRVALFNNEDDFLEKPVHAKSIKATSKEVSVKFENLPQGDYAVSVFHDENSNGELDKSVVGIPKEGFVFGNNAMGTFGPPAFNKAKIQLKDQNVIQELSLKYM
jgi:uncharacterized protein (DUF2141 family)